MTIFSITSTENATKKRSKLHRSGQDKACKIVAFRELTSLQQTHVSKRQATAILEVPFSTMKSWETQKIRQNVEPELVKFITTPVGQTFLHRLITSALMATRYGKGGVRTLQEFLRHSQLDHFVASSTAALHAYVVRAEEYMAVFGASQEMMLAQNMKQRKNT